jgi:hypothetical protein
MNHVPKTLYEIIVAEAACIQADADITLKNKEFLDTCSMLVDEYLSTDMNTETFEQTLTSLITRYSI